MQQRYRLREIDNVDVVALAKYEGRHFWVPTVRLMPEMSTRLEETPHSKVRQSHDRFLRFFRRGRLWYPSGGNTTGSTLEAERAVRVCNGGSYRAPRL